ncbi:MAG: PPE domain-containing protein, partial [Sciscionella sp.]
MTDVRWRGVSHEQLYNWINSGEGSRASTPQLDYWNRLGGSLADVHHNLTGRLSKLNVDWRGGA